MATNTTNLSLIKPAGTDKVRIAQINHNMDIIDAAIGAVGSTSLQAQISAIGSGLAIMSNGNTHVAITPGQYVYVRNHNTLSDGLYKATSNISANGTLSTSNVSSLSSGGANDLKSQIDSLNSQKATIYSIASDTEILTFAPGAYMIALNANSEYIPSRYGTLVIHHASGNYGVAIFASSVGKYYFRHMNGTTGWHTDWIQLANAPMIMIKSYSYTIGSIAAGAEANISANDFGFSTPSEYAPIGIRRASINNSNFYIRGMMANATGTNTALWSKNTSSGSSPSNATANMDIIYVRTDMVGT